MWKQDVSVGSLLSDWLAPQRGEIDEVRQGKVLVP